MKYVYLHLEGKVSIYQSLSFLFIVFVSNILNLDMIFTGHDN